MFRNFQSVGRKYCSWQVIRVHIGTLLQCQRRSDLTKVRKPPDVETVTDETTDVNEESSRLMHSNGTVGTVLKRVDLLVKEN